MNLCRIAVLDGSSDLNERDKNLHLAEKHLVHHKWYDPKLYAGYARMVDALETAGTEYAIFMPDDDYYLYPTIQRCIEVLDSDPSIVGAYGSDLLVSIASDAESQTMQLMTLGTNLKLDYTFDSPFSRILYAMGEVQRSTYFSVYRSEVLHRAFTAALEHAVVPESDGNLVDAKCFYFGDVIVGFVPLLYGKMAHVDAHICAYEVGQSVDEGERLHHGMLTNDVVFDYSRRTRMFVEGMAEEAKLAGIKADPALVRSFFTSLLATFIGRLALTNGLVPDYNSLLGLEHYEMQFHAGFLDMVSHDKITLEEARNGDGPVCHAFQQYEPCLNHLADWVKATHVTYLSMPYPEMNLYNGLHSRLRPQPFGTIGYSTTTKNIGG